MKVGFIGLGNMGKGMAENLLAKGAALTVFTRTPSKITAMQAKGALGASSAGEIANKVDILFTCLTDVDTSRSVIIGEIAKNARPDQIVVDHSTVNTQTSLDCASALRSKGAKFLDAPISGGSGRAEDGTLSIMVGGDAEAFQTAKPFFEMMGKNIWHMGETGAGTAMKLVNQLLVGVHSLAAAEAFAFANASGLDLETAAKVLSVSWGNSEMVRHCAPEAKSRNFANSPSPIRNLDKDMRIISDACNTIGLDLQLTKHTLDSFAKMMMSGKGEHALAAVIEVIEARSNCRADV